MDGLQLFIAAFFFPAVSEPSINGNEINGKWKLSSEVQVSCIPKAEVKSRLDPRDAYVRVMEKWLPAHNKIHRLEMFTLSQCLVQVSACRCFWTLQ